VPRLFTGLAVPPAIADALTLYQGGLPGARWIDPDDFHVTLRFIGDIDASTADDVVEALSAMRARPALTVTLAAEQAAGALRLGEPGCGADRSPG
jgi:RNA 2',3'-cyclic 3'-phosphodiesterase